MALPGPASLPGAPSKPAIRTAARLSPQQQALARRGTQRWWNLAWIGYQIDCFLSWSPASRFLLLGLLAFSLIVFLASLALLVVPDPDFRFVSALWWAFIRVLDTSRFADEKTSSEAVVAFLACLAGLVVLASLISLVSTAMSDKLEDLRRGKASVLEENHTLILGFHPEKLVALVRELHHANVSNKCAAYRERSSPAIVILSTEPKEHVETLILDRLGHLSESKVVVREGSPFLPTDLKKVAAGRARSIIILDEERDEDHDPRHGEEHLRTLRDMEAVKVVLALRQVPGAFTNNHAVVELQDTARKAVVQHLGEHSVETIIMTETLSRMMVQTARIQGLSAVYQDILSFEGSEFYFRRIPEATGKKFGDLQAIIEGAAVVGVLRPVADAQPGEPPFKYFLNPEDSLEVQADDHVLIVAESGHSFTVVPPRRIEVPAVSRALKRVPHRTPEQYLIIGFSQQLAMIVKEFDLYLAPGSQMFMMPGISEPALKQLFQHTELKNVETRFVAGDPSAFGPLSACVSILPPTLRCILVISDDRLEQQVADAKTISAVLLLFELLPKTNRPRIISEILDIKSKDLLDAKVGCEFVLSTEITSRLIAQVAEQRALNEIFVDLMSEEGNELYLKAAAGYVPLEQPADWLVLQRIARNRGETAIGYITAAGKVHMNPPQRVPLVLHAGDRIVVVAPDDQEYEYDGT